MLLSVEECDKSLCSSKVLVIFGKLKGEETLLLAFCGHHGNAEYVYLTREGWIVLDDNRVFRIEDPKGSKAAKKTTRRQTLVQEGPEDFHGGVDEGEGEVSVS